MKFLVGFLLVVGILTSGIFLLTRSTHGQNGQQKQQEQQEQQDEPTVVKRGKVTQKEREYSREYKKLYSHRKGLRLGEISGKEPDISVTSDEPDVIVDPDAPIITASDLLKKISCNADVIVVGSVKNKSAHLTEDETFVYTEYEFSIKDVVKDNAASHVEVNSSIEIARPGGVVKLNNRRIKVEDRSYELLEKNKDYLLFLRFVPSTNGYVISNEEGDFILENSYFKKLTKREFHKELDKSKSQDLLNSIRNTLSNRCSQNSKENNQ